MESNLISWGQNLNLQQYQFNFEPDFDKYQLIERRQGDNAVYYDPETERFIKFIDPVINEDKYLELRREIIIGKFLHAYDPKHFVNIIGYVKFHCPNFENSDVDTLLSECEGVLTRRIQGETLTNFILHCRPRDFKDVIVSLFSVLIQTNKKYDFTHYDLHTDNVFVSRSDIGDFENLSELNYYPVILDFGSSYIKIPYNSDLSTEDISFMSTPNNLIIGRNAPKRLTIMKSFIYMDFFRVLRSSILFTDYDYQGFIDDMIEYLETIDTLEIFKTEERYTEFLEAASEYNLVTVKDFIKVMNDYKSEIDFVDLKYNKFYEKTIDIYRKLTLEQKSNYDRIYQFCDNVFQLLGIPYYEDTDFNAILYSNKYKNFDLNDFLEKVKSLEI